MKATVLKLLTTTKDFFIKHSPEILTGMGIAGMITATVLAVKATPDAIKRVGKVKRNNGGTISKTEEFKAVAPCYVPTVIITGVSIACLVGSNSINHKRNMALAAAYALSETTLTDYQAKMLETFGERNVQKVEDAIAKDKVEKNPVNDNEVIVTGKGESLCYDTISGRYFMSDLETIRQTVNELNAQLLEERFISQNEFFYALGLGPTGSGYELGWNYDHQGLIDVGYSAQMAADGRPCIALQYRVQPNFKYNDR